MLMRTRSERAFTAMRSLRYEAMCRPPKHLTGEDHPYHASFPLYFGIFDSAQKHSPQPSKSLQDPLGLCPRPWGNGYVFLRYGHQYDIPELVLVAIKWLGLPESGTQPPVLPRLAQDSHQLLDHKLLRVEAMVRTGSREFLLRDALVTHGWHHLYRRDPSRRSPSCTSKLPGPPLSSV